VHTPPPPAEPGSARPGGDLVGGAVRTAGQVAEAGIAIATELTKTVLRRLPRR
jgi:hypothetical protein